MATNPGTGTGGTGGGSSGEPPTTTVSALLDLRATLGADIRLYGLLSSCFEANAPGTIMRTGLTAALPGPAQRNIAPGVASGIRIYTGTGTGAVGFDFRAKPLQNGLFLFNTDTLGGLLTASSTTTNGAVNAINTLKLNATATFFIGQSISHNGVNHIIQDIDRTLNIVTVAAAPGIGANSQTNGQAVVGGPLAEGFELQRQTSAGVITHRYFIPYVSLVDLTGLNSVRAVQLYP